MQKSTTSLRRHRYSLTSSAISCMQFGTYSYVQHSFMRTSTGKRSSVTMASRDWSSPDFSLTQLITPRSTVLPPLPLLYLLMTSHRVLLATIKYLGGCPCPRCKITKAEIPDMGTKKDMRKRQNVHNVRVDSSWFQQKIEMVRSWIFEKGYSITSKAVDTIMKPESLVPTRVSLVLKYIYILSDSLLSTERFHQIAPLWAELLLYVCSRFFT